MRAYTIEELNLLFQERDKTILKGINHTQCDWDVDEIEKYGIEDFLDWLRESELNGKVDEILENEK